MPNDTKITKPGLGALTTLDDASLAKLREKTGLVQRLGVARATSKVAGEALKGLEAAKVGAEANIALTALKLSETAIRSSMVASAMPAIGALTTNVNAATTAVDQALTNSSMAEVFTHMNNRATNLALKNTLLAAGKITEEEAEVLAHFAQMDAVEDIQASRRRMQEAKEAVAALHEFALEGIAAAKDLLK